MAMRNRRSFLKASGGVVTIGAFAGCSSGGDGGDGGDGSDGGDGGDGSDGGSTGTPSDGSAADPITIGALEPISGPFLNLAEPHRDGLQFAIQEVNDNGGVLGRELEVSVADTGADAAQADSIFRRMVEQEDAVATTGAVSSDTGIRLRQTANDLEVPHIVNRAGADEVITADNRYLFRFGLHPASPYIEAHVEAFADRGFSSIGAIIADYAYGRSIQAAIEEEFDQDVHLEVAPIGASDFTSYLRQFPSDLEMLITSGHPPGFISMANQAVDLGLSPEIITGAHGAPTTLFDGLNPDALEAWAHTHNSDPFRDDFAEVGERYGEAHDAALDTNNAYGYVTGKMLAQAIEDAGEADPVAIADAIRNIEFDELMAQPVQYTEYGELQNASVLFTHLREGTPSWDSDGNIVYEEIARSGPVPARELS